MAYRVSTSSGRTIGARDLPGDVALSPAVSASVSHTPDNKGLAVETLRRVDRGRLELVHHETLSGATTQSIRLAGDEPTETVLVQALVGAIAFLTDIPLTVSPAFHLSRFDAEDAEDEAMLREFGTADVFTGTSAQVVRRAFLDEPLTGDRLEWLLHRPLGVRLYADAIRANSVAGEFRDLWGVLESAFGEQGEDLVTALAAYGPATALGFDETSLEALMTLRDRASGAASQGGVADVLRVERECRARRSGLKLLVERVILTKRAWGSPDGDVEVTPLFRSPDG
jgi:hypothetical protein